MIPKSDRVLRSGTRRNPEVGIVCRHRKPRSDEDESVFPLTRDWMKRTVLAGKFEIGYPGFEKARVKRYEKIEFIEPVRRNSITAENYLVGFFQRLIGPGFIHYVAVLLAHFT